MARFFEEQLARGRRGEDLVRGLGRVVVQVVR